MREERAPSREEERERRIGNEEYGPGRTDERTESGRGREGSSQQGCRMDALVEGTDGREGRNGMGEKGKTQQQQLERGRRKGGRPRMRRGSTKERKKERLLRLFSLIQSGKEGAFPSFPVSSLFSDRCVCWRGSHTRRIASSSHPDPSDRRERRRIKDGWWLSPVVFFPPASSYAHNY